VWVCCTVGGSSTPASPESMAAHWHRTVQDPLGQDRAGAPVPTLSQRPPDIVAAAWGAISRVIRWLGTASVYGVTKGSLRLHGPAATGGSSLVARIEGVLKLKVNLDGDDYVVDVLNVCEHLNLHVVLDCCSVRQRQPSLA
jgi:hypothetical protein